MAGQQTTKGTHRRSVPRLVKIIRQFNCAYPDAKLDLDFSTPLELLISLILAAQSRDDLVNQVTPGLFRKFRTVEDYAGASLPGLENKTRRVNFRRIKTRRIKDCCREIVKRHRGRIPQTINELTALPGVGRKTANILLSNAFGRQAIGVDTHVMRLSQRLGFTRNTNPDEIEFDLIKIVPEEHRIRFCHLLQYHGQRVCFARKPLCPECTISPLCPFPEKMARS
jgi:endonuclease-3